LAPEPPKEPGGGAGGMAEDAEKIPGRPVFRVEAREELKTRGGKWIETAQSVGDKFASLVANFCGWSLTLAPSRISLV
jgi:hypothetical protein